jgi:hypothetical protein
MKIGLLWYDDTGADLATKVEEAAQRYRDKFGRRPNRCYVNPADLPAEESGFSHDGIKLMASSAILPDHFWVGIERGSGRGAGPPPNNFDRPRGERGSSATGC